MNIIRIEYDYTHGSMNGYDFHIDVSEKGVAYASYFAPNQGKQLKSNGEITEKRWAKLIDATENLFSCLSLVDSVPETGEGYIALDEGTENLFITVLYHGKEKRTQYVCPHNDKFNLFTEALRKAAEKA